MRLQHQPVGDVADRRRARRRGADRQQRLVLLRRQPDASGLLLAEADEPAQREAGVGERAILAVALRWQAAGADPAATLAESLSGASQPFAHPETPSSRVAELMIAAGIGRIPIVEHGTRRVVGLLSRQDLLKARCALRQAESSRIRFVGKVHA